MRHSWDGATNYCVRCGRAREWIENSLERNGCNPPDNLIAISHIIARRRADELILRVAPSLMFYGRGLPEILAESSARLTKDYASEFERDSTMFKITEKMKVHRGHIFISGEQEPYA